MSEEIKRGRGRPRKPVETEQAAPKPTYKMKAKPNWEAIEYDAEGLESPDKLRIAPELVPTGMSLQWVTNEVLGQSVAHHRAQFEKTGWTPVHQEDFDGVFNGMFMPFDREGEINLEGMVLMARPKELTDRAKRQDRRRALEQVAIKEASLRGGDIGVTLDSQHPSAARVNRVNKTIERIEIPRDE